MIKEIYDRLTSHIDGPLLTFLLIVMALGLAVLYSAAGANPDKVFMQGRSMLVALISMWVVANLHPQQMMRLALPIYLFGLILLLCVALFGDVSHGARRWLHVGVTRIQPSELMKLAIPLVLAWFFHRYESHLRWKEFLLAALMLAIPAALILKQPDLGTTLLICASGFYVLFLAGLSWKLIVAGALSIAALIPTVWPMLHDYQRRRVLTLLDPTSDPLGSGYHIIQSTIALGSGGIIGKGWLKGSQGHLDFLPEPTTDFIFAVFAEEFGFIGNMILLLLYILIIGRSLMITVNASTLFARLLAGAITLTFFTYAFVNMGMVSGILPVVGVPLPLLSYGGTSLLTMMVGFGILMSIETHKQLVQS
ncbi:MAG: rod shape-determining protein RodA [Burkholderiales bacterium]